MPMTDKEKLEQLFQAALKSNDNPGKSLKRAFPQVAAVPKMPVTPPGTEGPQTEYSASIPPATATAGRELLVEPMPNAGLDEASSAELGALLESQLKRVAAKRRRELMVTLAVVAGLAGGGFGWFIHSPSRVTAFKSAITEIRSIGDIKGMMAKYQVALDKVAERGKQIDQSSHSIGSDPASVKQDEDLYMEKETQAFTGENGSGTGARNKQLQEKFGKFAKAPADSGHAEEPSSSTAIR